MNKFSLKGQILTLFIFTILFFSALNFSIFYKTITDLHNNSIRSEMKTASNMLKSQIIENLDLVFELI